jgi:hypothetical protein
MIIQSQIRNGEQNERAASVGRQVNVVTTKNMAFYLDGTIERLCRERLGDGHGKQYYSRDAVAFREGIADRVIEKIIRRRRDIEAKEKADQAEAARKAASAGISLATTMTIAGVSEREEAGNYDFLHGEGAWAKKLEREAEWERDWDKRQAERAKAEAEAEKLHAEWAAANPEEAAKEAAKDRARERARDRRAARSSNRYYYRETAEDHRKSSGEYHAGYEAGKNVSIEPQMDSGANRKIGR